jgi:hypothetical protein
MNLKDLAMEPERRNENKRIHTLVHQAWVEEGIYTYLPGKKRV